MTSESQPDDASHPPADVITIVSFGETPRLNTNSASVTEGTESSRGPADAHGAGTNFLYKLFNKQDANVSPQTQAAPELNTVADALQVTEHVLPWWVIVALKLFGLRIFKGVSSVVINASGEVEVSATFRLFGHDFHIVIRGEVAYDNGVKIANPSVARDSRDDIMADKTRSGSAAERAIIKMIDRSTRSILEAQYQANRHNRLIQDLKAIDRQVVSSVLASAASYVKQKSDQTV